MSTRNNDTKASTTVPKKKITHTSISTTKNKEETKDVKNLEKGKRTALAKDKIPLEEKLKKIKTSVTKDSPKVTKQSSQKPISSSRNNISSNKPNVSSTKPTTSSSKVSLSSSKTTSSTTRSSKEHVPLTPPSSRVSKTQFFPSKNMYSHALKEASDTSTELDTKNVQEKEKTKRVSKENVQGKEKPRRIDKEKKQVIKKSSTNPKTSTRIKNAENTDTSSVSINIERKHVKEIKELKRNSKERDPVTRKSKTGTNIKNQEIPEVILSDLSSISERPRTATLRKGSIVNENIVGPDAPKLKLKEKLIPTLTSSIAESPKSDEDNYEDDFESYESDFESFSDSSNLSISGSESSTSTEKSPRDVKSAEKRSNSAGTDEERKLDSGTFELPDFKHKQILDNIKESIEKENAIVLEQNRNNPASLSDEGFEEAKSLQFINFMDAQKKYERKKSVQLKRKRGEEILSMIQLDTYNFTLFEIDPIPYDIFIKSYGDSNSVQTSAQTGEDDKSVEIQTDDISKQEKWTQFPVNFRKLEETDANFWKSYREDFLGVGGKDCEFVNDKKLIFNETNLNRFIKSAGTLILKLQEENNTNDLENIMPNTRKIPFSEGYVRFNTKTEVFKNRSLVFATFSNETNDKILTVHGASDFNDYKSVISIWNVWNSDVVLCSLKCFNEVTCCTFGERSSSYLFAGANDGTICVWDIKDVYREQKDAIDVPNFCTNVLSGHHQKIVAIETLNKGNNDFLIGETEQICSLDEGGEIILWNVFVKETKKYNLFDIRQEETVLLNKNVSIKLSDLNPKLVDLQCTDFFIDNLSFIYVSTNYGFIIQHPINGSKINLKKYMPETVSEATCLEICPFSQDFFLAGFTDGNINLYSKIMENPIMILSNTENDYDKRSVQIVQWSQQRPFIFYTKDATNTVHIWDLSQSDIFPIYSIPFEKDIGCLKLSSLKNNSDDEKSYMIIGSKDGTVDLHILNPQNPATMKRDTNRFLDYVNRL